VINGAKICLLLEEFATTPFTSFAPPVASDRCAATAARRVMLSQAEVAEPAEAEAPAKAAAAAVEKHKGVGGMADTRDPEPVVSDPPTLKY
jgi:hypothetical protein